MSNEDLLEEIAGWLGESTSLFDESSEHKSWADVLTMTQQDIEHWFAQWLQKLPEDQKQFLTGLVECSVTYLSGFIQQSRRCDTVEQQVLRQARPFHAEMVNIAEMKQLKYEQIEYVEEKCISKYRWYALAQGGLTGTGSPLWLSLDFPALIGINLNMLHYMAAAYGHSFKNAEEQALALQILYAATLPKQYKSAAWSMLVEQYVLLEPLDVHAKASEQTLQQEWLETWVKHLLKAAVIYGLKLTSRKKVSLLGVMYGAGINYQFTKDVARFASYFYRYRYFEEKKRTN